MLDLPTFNQFRQSMLDYAHGGESIPPELQKVYDDLAERSHLTETDLKEIGSEIQQQFFPKKNFNQVRKRMFAAMGYRSTGLLDHIRVRYTRTHGLAELHYPNLWHEFAKGFDNSVFGSPMYGDKQFIVPYLEMLYEPYFQYYSSSDDNAKTLMAKLNKALEDPSALPGFFDDERFILGFYLYTDLANDKTQSVAILTQWAEVFAHVVRVKVTDALNIAAIAIGYKAWTVALDAQEEGSITNTRYQWVYTDTV